MDEPARIQKNWQCLASQGDIANILGIPNVSYGEWCPTVEWWWGRWVGEVDFEGKFQGIHRGVKDGEE